jgi:NAD(P)-dependent dehydrogenase (short-subunit alcohol dehydrogenase family)
MSTARAACGLGWAVARRWLALAGLLLFVGCATQLRTGVVGQAEGTGGRSLQAQLEALEKDPTASTERRVIFVGAALNGRQDVFDRDVTALDTALAQRFGSEYRSVLLSNLRIAQPPRTLPLASIDHLDDVFEALERTRRPHDRFIVLFTTHGAVRLLEVEQAALWKEPRLINDSKIAAWMKQLAPQPTWLILSACHAGSHLRSLGASHLITMTAAAADRLSFGCQNDETNTWFVHELLRALPTSTSLDQLWRSTLAAVAERERAMKFKESLPQRRIAPAMKERWDGPLQAF